MTEIGIKSGLGFYSHSEIVGYAKENEYEMNEVELNDAIGESFIVLKGYNGSIIYFYN
jgi:hypothetical protein